MRQVAGIALAAVLTPMWVDPSTGAEAVAMPYECRMDGARLLVSASAERVYQIVGTRTELPVTSCVATSAGSGCRSFLAHSMALRCGTATVAWIEVAAAIAPHRLGRATVDDGRLNIRLERRGAGCAQPGKPGIESECRQLQPLSARGRPIVFPAGYAPLSELGARIVDFAAMRAAHSNSGHSSAVVASATGAGTLQSSSGWVTVIERFAETRGGAGSEEVVEGSVPWLLLALALAVAAGILAARHPDVRARLIGWQAALRYRLPIGRRIADRDETAPEARTAREIERMASELLERIEARARALDAAQPLRRVLLREVHRHRRRVLAARTVAPEGSQGWPRHRARLQALVQDLVRLKDIVDGAERSLVPGDGPVTAPADRMEAYAVLGANPEVSERVMKKLVDALRACWHPDHAKSDADREQREARIKQINVAWDLISGKRQEA